MKSRGTHVVRRASPNVPPGGAATAVNASPSSGGGRRSHHPSSRTTTNNNNNNNRSSPTARSRNKHHHHHHHHGSSSLQPPGGSGGVTASAAYMGVAFLGACLCIAYWWFMYRLLFASSDSDSSDVSSWLAPNKGQPHFAWLEEEHNKDDDINKNNKNPTATHINNNSRLGHNKVIYVGMFGLGHRLSKMAGAHHMAQTYGSQYWPIHSLEILWGSCGPAANQSANAINDKNGTTTTISSSSSNPDHDDQQQQDIFTHLFGHHQIAIARPPKRKFAEQDYFQGKSLVMRNDVAGYYAGQVYKNAQLPLTRRANDDASEASESKSSSSVQKTKTTLPLALWEQKLDLDADLYRQLLTAFEAKHGNTTLVPFQDGHRWKQHYVIGLHVRAGNGEEQHFEQAQREIANPSVFYDNLVATVRDYLEATNSSSTNNSKRQILRRRLPGSRPRKKKPLIFVATDTVQVVQELQRRFAKIDVPVISVTQQPRVSPHQGVSYSAWQAGSEHCLPGWLYSMVDMSLLAKSNMVIAARRSTFTQTMPRSLLLDEPEVEMEHDRRKSRYYYHVRGYKFCEVNDSGDAMTCFATRNAWMLRHDPNQAGQQDEEDPWDIGSMPMIRTFGAGATAMENNNNNGNKNDNSSNNQTMVTHKLMVHFPDIIFNPQVKNNHSVGDEDEDVQWLKRAQDFWDPTQTANQRMQFGFKIAKKYRRYNDFHPHWKLQ